MPIDLKGLDKADVLCALYNNSRPQGLGLLQARPGGLTREEATKLLAKSTYFDYLFGRVMKVDLSRDELDPRLYDRDLGEGAAERIVNTLRKEQHANH